MFNKIKALPHKKAFIIGLFMVLVGSTLWFNFWARIIGGILWGIGFLFIIIASDKKHLNRDK